MRKDLRTNALGAGLVMLMVIVLLVSLSYAWYGNVLMTPLKDVTGHVIYLARYFESGNGRFPNKLTSGYTGSGDNETWVPGENIDGDIASKAEFQSPSTDGAFEIKTPEQLYNLAWLQFMGYFSDPDETAEGDDKKNIPEYYFYLSADLDMSGYVLPPIGTAEYPFIGNFDGNGHSIIGLGRNSNAAQSNVAYRGYR